MTTDDQQALAALRALQVNGFDPLAAALDYPRLEEENARLRAALESLVSLSQGWEPQGRATRKFCDKNNAAVAAARAALAGSR